MRFTTATFEKSVAAGPDSAEFIFRPERPLVHSAGQFGMLFLPRVAPKPFTFASDANSDILSIATSLRSASKFKQKLACLAPGDRVRVAGAMGSALDDASTIPPVYVAQGVGITPFLSIARTSGSSDAHLIHVGSPEWFDEAAAGMRTAERHSHRADLHEAIDRALNSNRQAKWSLSGRFAFVSSVAAQLTAAGVRRNQIRKDAFWTMGEPQSAAA